MWDIVILMFHVMRFSSDNLNKPSHKRFKKLADFFLYSLPLYLGAILAMPISEDYKLWINAGVTIVIITIKGLSKFTSDEA